MDLGKSTREPIWGKIGLFQSGVRVDKTCSRCVGRQLPHTKRDPEVPRVRVLLGLVGLGSVSPVRHLPTSNRKRTIRRRAPSRAFPTTTTLRPLAFIAKEGPLSASPDRPGAWARRSDNEGRRLPATKPATPAGRPSPARLEAEDPTPATVAGPNRCIRHPKTGIPQPGTSRRNRQPANQTPPSRRKEGSRRRRRVVAKSSSVGPQSPEHLLSLHGTLRP